MGFEKTLRSIADRVRPDRQTLILANSGSREIVDLADYLLEDYVQFGIHGSKTRSERQRALDAFKSGSSSILVVTDVAAQRLEIDRVRFVVHYDQPANAHVYATRVNYASQCGTVREWRTPFWLPTTHVMRRSSSHAFKTPARRLHNSDLFRKSKVGWLLRKPNWKNIQLQQFEQNLYEKHPTTASRSMTEVEAYRSANGVWVKGRDVPKPILA
ncbi:hypothetical protein MTO96_004789 [Rhipicephalus appendiculatus]